MSSLKQMIQRMATQANDQSGPVQLVQGVVVGAPPNLSVRLKNNNKLIIPKDLLIVAEHLTRHTRTIRVNGGAAQTYEFMDELKTGDRVMVEVVQGGQSFFITDRVKTY